MLQPKPTPITIAVILVILLVVFFSSASRYAPETTSQYSAKVSNVIESYSASRFTNEADRVTNGTLGFEKVFVVGLPERSDKRDALALTSSLTGFKIDYIDGVKGETIPDKAVPFGADRKKLWENNLGSWRGHMNAAREIIENEYSSALIMEDDVDWDVRLKAQLQRFVQGTRFIQTPPKTKPSKIAPHSPYGDDWDLLWLGHCGEVFPEDLEEYRALDPKDPLRAAISRKYVIDNEMTLPPPDKITGYQNFTAFPNTRWVHQSGGPICTFSYALSLRGARKVLYDLSVDHLLGPFDNALANLCRYGADPERMGMKCITATPPLFFHHKAKGYIGGDSDIQKVGSGKADKGEIREKGFTENIDCSARNNIRNMMLGLPIESQFVHEKAETSGIP